MKKKEIINIDDKEYEFTSGETIIQVARRNDIYIPNLCYIEGLAPFGSCRLCVVKIPGARKQYQAACATPATDGLKVITKNEDLQEMRREVLQMLLSEHPNNCLICGHNGVCKDLNINHEKKISQRIFGCFSCPRKEDCELRTLVKYLEITELTYDFSYKNIEVEDNDLFFDRDYNLCILCGKCVRMCSEFRGMHILDFIERGHDTIVSTPMSLLHKDTNCQFCGSCIDICPVGVYKAKGSNWQIPKDNIIETTCGFCSLGCEFKLLYNDKKELVECQPVNMDKKSINKGQGCIIGRFCAPEFVKGKDRLTIPLMMNDDKIFEESNWDTIFNDISSDLKNYKADEIGIIASPDMTNESAYLLNEFATKILKLPDTNLGVNLGGMNLEKFTDLIKYNRSVPAISDSKWILLINSNPQITHNILQIYLVKAANNECKLTSLIDKATHSDLQLPPETLRILQSNEMVTEKEIIKVINTLNDEPGTIIINGDSSSNILTAITEKANKRKDLNILPLYSRTNLERVFSLFPNSAESVLSQIEKGKIKALISMERIPDAIASKLEILIVQDIYPSESSKHAKYILPTTTWAETEGTITSIELKNTPLSSGIENFSSIKQDSEIITQLALSLSNKKVPTSFKYKTISEVTDKIPEIKTLKIKNKIKFDGGNKGISGYNHFVYRGESIRNKVSDLNELIENRENNEELQTNGFPEKDAKSSEKEQSKEITILLDEDGKIYLNGQTYGLNSLNSIIEAQSYENSPLTIIVDENVNFVIIDEGSYCLCNNYKDNLMKSELLLNLPGTNGSTHKNLKYYIKKKEKEGKDFILEETNGLILISPELINTETSAIEEKITHLFENKQFEEPGMKSLAITTGKNVIRSSTIINNTIDSKTSNYNWNTWQSKTTPSKNPIQQKNIVFIDQQKCMGCGTCQEVCPHDAINMMEMNDPWVLDSNNKRQYAGIYYKNCFKCARCVVNCPVNAITIKKKIYE